VIRPAQNAWDAWADVPPDVAVDAALLHRPGLAGADAEKLAGRARDVQASGVRSSSDEPRSEHRAAAEAERAAVAELCIPGAGLSAARSCVAQEVPGQPEELTKPGEQLDAARPELAAQPRLSRSETLVLRAGQLLLAAQIPDAEAQQPQVRMAQRGQTVFPKWKEA
jgi:hypothetical protein